MVDAGPAAGPIRIARDAGGIFAVTIDDPAQRVNTMTDAFRDALHEAVDLLVAQREAMAGVIVTSAKPTFFAGGDLGALCAVDDDNLAEYAASGVGLKADLRRLETLGRPVVAALNGTALGGGLEIALACHHRIALVGAKTRFGFPEVTLGLLPGAGGIVRTVRMLGLRRALDEVLLTGKSFGVDDALRVGLIDGVVHTHEDLDVAARSWIRDHPTGGQPWDAPGYRMPSGGPGSSELDETLLWLAARLRVRLRGVELPAPHHIVCAAAESVGLDLETALAVETSYFLDLVRGRIAKNLIHSSWFDVRAISSGVSRPAGHPEFVAHKVGVVGAGLMGAGIAYANAARGIPVVLNDVSLERATLGKEHARRALERRVRAGRLSPDERDQMLNHIEPSADIADFADCDLVVEAVFENEDLKHDVLAAAERAVAFGTVIGSNTSTLPITGLARAVERPSDVIGLHFFSPVDRMPLLEVIRGDDTSDSTLARALDYAAQIGKTPIVVRDSRGFFTSRVIGAFVHEAIALLLEGVPPSTIEQATVQAGYPVGALQLTDELNLGLFIHSRDETKAAAGRDGLAYQAMPDEPVVEAMVALGRLGRTAGAGFYDYDESGRRTRMWPGLTDLFPPVADPAALDFRELGERLLLIEALEAAKCVEEGVIGNAADANVGSILGIGYPAWTGGVLRYLNSYCGAAGTGIAGCVARADQLAERFGARYAPNALLRRMAAAGETF